MGKAENKVEGYLVTQAEKRGYLCWKFTSPGTDGVADRLLIGKGYVIFVECKSEVGSVRKLQKHMLEEVGKRGAYQCVANTRDKVDILLTWLDSRKTRKNIPLPF